MKRIILFLTLSISVHASPIRAIPSPASEDSQCSNLIAGPDGTLYLTWYESVAESSGLRALRLSLLRPDEDVWSKPTTIVATDRLMENWADFASLIVGTDGALTAQWFQRPDGEGRGYSGWYSRSEDQGKTWKTPAPLGHEFVALAPLSGGRTMAVWLESTRTRDSTTTSRLRHDSHASRPTRDPMAPYLPSMKLLARLLARDGSTLGEWTVDPDVCTCCHNSVAVLPGDRVWVAYRGHNADEIRDNLYAVFDPEGGWSKPETLRNDGWKIAACPVNGPAVDARGDDLAVSWFTIANDQPRVQARFSKNSGQTLSDPVVIDLGQPMGRLETLFLSDGSAVLLWMEMGQDENAAGIYVRRMSDAGVLSPAALVIESSQARASGFPRAAPRGSDTFLLSYTETGKSNQVKVLEVTLSKLIEARAIEPTRKVKRVSSARPAPEFCQMVSEDKIMSQE